MRPGFEIPEELLEDYYDDSVDEAEDEEVDEELLEDYYGGSVGETEDEETQPEVKNEGDRAEEEILVKENEESELFNGSHSTSKAEPTVRDDNSTGLIGEVTLSNQHFKFSTKVKCR